MVSSSHIGEFLFVKYDRKSITLTCCNEKGDKWNEIEFHSEWKKLTWQKRKWNWCFIFVCFISCHQQPNTPLVCPTHNMFASVLAGSACFFFAFCLHLISAVSLIFHASKNLSLLASSAGMCMQRVAVYWDAVTTLEFKRTQCTVYTSYWHAPYNTMHLKSIKFSSKTYYS